MTAAALQLDLHPAVEGGLQLEVTEVRPETEDILCITFEDPLGGPLPPFVAGSHLVVQYGKGANAYSLTGSGDAPSQYSISVLRCDGGAGGSLAMHGLAVGDRVNVSRPRSSFAPVANAAHHLLIAAGIGITPMLSHARYAAEWGGDASLIYVYRPGAGAHVAEARQLLGENLTECNGRVRFQEVLAEALTSQKLGTHLYVCGPDSFMETVLAQARSLGWPKARLHSEAFGAAEFDAGDPFTVSLARSGMKLEVPSGVSLLEALENVGKTVPNMCRKGICGECSLTVLRGKPLHRDLYLTDQEKSENTTMMCCVSRSEDQELELDL